MNPNMYFLTSKRIGFKTWASEDLGLAVNLWGNYEVTRLFDRRGALSKEQVEKRLFNEIEMEEKYGVQYWPIFLISSSEHIGACGLRPYGDSQDTFELGIHLCPEHWGRGYAAEACRAMIEYAFSALKIKRLFAGHNPKNEGSRFLLKKVGFIYSHDEYYEPTGLNHPSYFLSREDYMEIL